MKDVYDFFHFEDYAKPLSMTDSMPGIRNSVRKKTLHCDKRRTFLHQQSDLVKRLISVDWNSSSPFETNTKLIAPEGYVLFLNGIVFNFKWFGLDLGKMV